MSAYTYKSILYIYIWQGGGGWWTHSQTTWWQDPDGNTAWAATTMGSSSPASATSSSAYGTAWRNACSGSGGGAAEVGGSAPHGHNANKGGSAPRRNDDESAAKRVRLPNDNDFPEGQFVTSRWPVTISAYPEKGQKNSWSAIMDVAKKLGCIVRLHGRREKHRRNRHIAQLSVKGECAEDVFYMILRRSKRALPTVKFTSTHLKAPTVTECYDGDGGGDDKGQRRRGKAKGRG